MIAFNSFSQVVLCFQEFITRMIVSISFKYKFFNIFNFLNFFFNQNCLVQKKIQIQINLMITFIFWSDKTEFIILNLESKKKFALE